MRHQYNIDLTPFYLSSIKTFTKKINYKLKTLHTTYTMDKRIILLLLSLITILILIQNNTSIWIYIIFIIFVMGVWNMIDD